MDFPNNVLFAWRGSERVKGSDKPREVIELVFKCRINDSTSIVSMERKPNELFIETRKKMAAKLSQDKRSGTVVFDEHKILPSGVFPTDSDSLEKILYDDQCRALVIGKEEYRLVRDAPKLLRFEVRMHPIVGCPVTPSCDWKNETAEGNPEFHWYVSEKNPRITNHSIKPQNDGGIELDGWTYVATGAYFVPEAEHAGKHLAVAAVYGPGIVRTVMVKSPVVSIEEPLIFEAVQNAHCRERVPDGRYRVVSYNILADLYLNLKRTQENLYFGYCPKEFQAQEYRYPILLKELKGYNADLMFLQEVDNRMKVRYLEKFLDQCGFASTFKIKERDVTEGLMIAYRADRFRLRSTHDIWLNDLLDTATYPENADVVEYLDKHEAAKEVFLTRPNVLQVAHLETTSGRHILTANTHLFFDPAFDNIKALQSLLCLRHILRLKKQLGEADVSVIFAGDFNSTPDGGSVALISRGCVREDHPCWGKEPATFSVGDERLGLSSFCGFPTYTNFCYTPEYPGFAGCLDYIWGSSDFVVHKVLPLPRHDLVTKYGAIPSKIAPSDHLPIICEISLT